MSHMVSAASIFERSLRIESSPSSSILYGAGLLETWSIGNMRIHWETWREIAGAFGVKDAAIAAASRRFEQLLEGDITYKD